MVKTVDHMSGNITFINNKTGLNIQIAFQGLRIFNDDTIFIVNFLQRLGIDKVADAVKITLGPKGRNAILARKYMSPMVTNLG